MVGQPDFLKYVIGKNFLETIWRGLYYIQRTVDKLQGDENACSKWRAKKFAFASHHIIYAISDGHLHRFIKFSTSRRLLSRVNIPGHGRKPFSRKVERSAPSSRCMSGRFAVNASVIASTPFVGSLCCSPCESSSASHCLPSSS
jgi:hypothetical protein